MLPLEDKEHIVFMLPKFHCELNPIEHVWAQAKRYLKAYCNYSIRGLCNTIHPALDSVTLENVQNHFRKVRHYTFAYLEGVPGGSGLEKLVKVIKRFCHIEEFQNISKINPDFDLIVSQCSYKFCKNLLVELLDDL